MTESTCSLAAFPFSSSCTALVTLGHKSWHECGDALQSPCIFISLSIALSVSISSAVFDSISSAVFGSTLKTVLAVSQKSLWNKVLSSHPSKGQLRLHVGQSRRGTWLPQELMQARLAVAWSLYYLQGIFPALCLFRGICMQSSTTTSEKCDSSDGIWKGPSHCLSPGKPLAVPAKFSGGSASGGGILFQQAFLADTHTLILSFQFITNKHI